jgi:hypothetical protein
MTIRIYETEEKHSHMNEYFHLTLFEMCEGGSLKSLLHRTRARVHELNSTRQCYCQQSMMGWLQLQQQQPIGQGHVGYRARVTD